MITISQAIKKFDETFNIFTNENMLIDSWVSCEKAMGDAYNDISGCDKPCANQLFYIYNVKTDDKFEANQIGIMNILTDLMCGE